MNRRQKRKRIKIAINNYENNEMTAKDIHVLKTFGKKNFVEYKSGGFDTEKLIKAIKNVFFNIGVSFEVMGKSLQRIGISEKKAGEKVDESVQKKSL